MKIIEYEDKYLNNVRNLLLELEKVNTNNGKCYLAIENNKVKGLIMVTIPKYNKNDYLDYKCPERGIL